MFSARKNRRCSGWVASPRLRLADSRGASTKLYRMFAQTWFEQAVDHRKSRTVHVLRKERLLKSSVVERNGEMVDSLQLPSAGSLFKRAEAEEETCKAVDINPKPAQQCFRIPHFLC